MFDGHGSERTVTNSSQTVTGTLNVDAFGVQAGSTGSSSDPYMYAATSGYRNDGDAGLTLDGARYYDAAVGRFITRDTDLSQAPYCYCDGDPVNLVDEDGHAPIYLPVQPTQTGHGPIGTGTQEPPPGSQPDPFGPPPYGVQPPPEHKPWPPTDPGGINQSGPGGTFGWGGGKLKVTLPKGGGASGTYTHPFSGNGGNGTWGLGGYYDGHGGGAIGIGISWSG